MISWAFYPVLIATIVSIVGLSRIALKYHDREHPRTLSELAAAEQSVLVDFRYILLTCGFLFAIAVFAFIAPRIVHPIGIVIFGVLMIGGELLAAIIPARNRTLSFHYLMAQIMAVGMFGLAILFWLWLPKYGLVERYFSLLMIGLAVFTVLDKRRYLVYELAFIFSSHLTIMTAVLALRK